jgi:hypothetical protein
MTSELIRAPIDDHLSTPRRVLRVGGGFVGAGLGLDNT